jgi:hypothetical protein
VLRRKVTSAGIGLHAACKNPQEGGLAGTVCADQAEAFAFGNTQRNVFEQYARAEALRDGATASEERHSS